MADLAPGQHEPTQAAPYRRARDLVVWWDGDDAHALSARVGRVLRLTGPLLRMLAEAAHCSPLKDLASSARVPQALVQQLADVGLLEPADASPPSTPWPAVELAVQRRTGMSPPVDVDLRAAPAPLMQRPSGRRIIDLTCHPQPTRDAPFRDVLRARRSIRRFDTRPVTVAELAELLIEAAGLAALDLETASSRRPYPSGGARHSLELFVLSLRVADLEQGCWWFDPRGALVAVDTDARFRQQLAALLARDAVAPVGIILITSRFERSLYKYGALGLSLIYKDTGCLLQTLYLQATANKLAGYALGGGPEAAIATGLGLDPLHQSYVGAFVFGAALTSEDE